MIDATSPNAVASLWDCSGDGAIVAGFFRWRDAVLACDAHPGDGDDPEWEALLRTSDAIRTEVVALPANGAEGIAIKTYLALHRECGNRSTPFELDYDGSIMTDDGTNRHVIADAIRLSPALAAVVAAGCSASAAMLAPA